MKLNWNFLGGRRGEKQNTLCGGVWNFLELHIVTINLHGSDSDFASSYVSWPSRYERGTGATL